jgi:hypothetical protein
LTPWYSITMPSCCNSTPVADVWQLLAAKVALESDLGPAAAMRVAEITRAYSEWNLAPGDRTCRVGGASYAGAARLPVGQDMELTIEAPDYRPRSGVLALLAVRLAPQGCAQA